MPSRAESKRIQNFRFTIAGEIPRFPNNKETLRQLRESPLASVLIYYHHWIVRYVRPRPRTVDIEATVTSDSRWARLEGRIAKFLDKVKTGADLTPHLSVEPHTRGYTPASSRVGPTVDRWADKDFLLNVMGYHHFHLGETIGPNGVAVRTADVLFAKVARERFIAIGIFGHSVFSRARTATDEMTFERERLWRTFTEHSTRGLPPGSIYIPASITTSGHSLQLAHLPLCQ